MHGPAFKIAKIDSTQLNRRSAQQQQTHIRAIPSLSRQACRLKGKTNSRPGGKRKWKKNFTFLYLGSFTWN